MFNYIRIKKLWIYVAMVILVFNLVLDVFLLSSIEVSAQTTPIYSPMVIYLPEKLKEIPEEEPEVEVIQIDIPEPENPVKPIYTENAAEIEALAKTVWGEARGCNKEQQSMVVWCILNRVDAGGFGDGIIGVITKHRQFHGYSPSYPVQADIYELCSDVVEMWWLEKQGETVDRTLPQRFLYFYGDGRINHFTTKFGGGERWN